jgi:hypothetical protein
MKKSFQLILLYILAGFFSSSSAQKDIVISSNHSSSIRNYVAPLMVGNDILNVCPQGANDRAGSNDTSPIPYDVGTLSIDLPYYINPGVITPKATVFSNSSTTETFDVSMTIALVGYSSTKTVTNLPPGGIQQVIFDDWYAYFGDYIVEACTQLATDPNPENDCKSKLVHISFMQFYLYQLPNQVNGLFADETCSLCPTGQQTVADNFVYNYYPGNGISGIVIWGGYYPEDIPNTTDDFTIILHADNSGQPGSVIVTVTNLQPDSRVPTGVVLFGTHEYMFTFDFLNNPIWLPQGNAIYWIELFNNSIQSGNFYWELGGLDTVRGVAGSAWDMTTPGTNWNLDGSTDMSILVENDLLIPAELINFKATSNGSDVNLNWITATETNNRGFAVQRESDDKFVTIGFVQGNGTTTETHHYFYTDKNVEVGSYSYRLMQIDYDGTTHYSNEVEVEVKAIKEFALDQNYPNPFNPSTKIKYSLAVDSKVKLTVYNLLGEIVATLVNTNISAGNQEVTFEGTNLNNGIYFYRLEAVGVDGSNFSQVKKMVLTK